MKLPRDVSGERLISLLRALGYEVIRQKRSHARLFHPGPPPHSITVPLHRPLKTGTLHAILSEASRARSVPIDEILRLL